MRTEIVGQTKGQANKLALAVKCNAPNGLSIRLSDSRVWSPTNWTTSQQLKRGYLNYIMARIGGQMGESNEISNTIKFVLSGRRFPSPGHLPRTAPDFVLDDVCSDTRAIERLKRNWSSELVARLA